MRNSPALSAMGLAAMAGMTLLTSSCASKGPATRTDLSPRQQKIAKEMHESYVFQYSLTDKFNPAELRALAAEPKKDPARLAYLIGRAGAEKDSSFKDLPANATLRSSDTSVYLALLGYDYSVNGNQASLDKLLARLKKEEQGGDSPTTASLAYVDEWQSSPAAVKHFFRRTDGAGSIAKIQFWELREFFFPEHYAAYEKKAR